jgi:hypothetical protein
MNGKDAFRLVLSVPPTDHDDLGLGLDESPPASPSVPASMRYRESRKDDEDSDDEVSSR